MTGVRFPRSMLNGPGNERLLRFLGVEIVDDCDPDLEQAAREWLATQPERDRTTRSDHLPATKAVSEALERIDERRKSAA